MKCHRHKWEGTGPGERGRVRVGKHKFTAGLNKGSAWTDLLLKIEVGWGLEVTGIRSPEDEVCECMGGSDLMCYDGILVQRTVRGCVSRMTFGFYILILQSTTAPPLLTLVTITQIWEWTFVSRMLEVWRVVGDCEWGKVKNKGGPQLTMNKARNQI